VIDIERVTDEQRKGRDGTVGLTMSLTRARASRTSHFTSFPKRLTPSAYPCPLHLLLLPPSPVAKPSPRPDHATTRAADDRLARDISLRICRVTRGGEAAVRMHAADAPRVADATGRRAHSARRVHRAVERGVGREGRGGERTAIV